MTCKYAFDKGQQILLNKLHSYANSEFEKYQLLKHDINSSNPNWWLCQGRINQIFDLMSEISKLMQEKHE